MWKTLCITSDLEDEDNFNAYTFLYKKEIPES